MKRSDSMSIVEVECRRYKDDLSPEENASPLSVFDTIIGHIEDILIDEEFLELQKSFLEKYCEEFDDTEENKLIYTSIFEGYVSKIENYIEQRLKKEVIDFDLEDFYEELHKRRSSLDGEVFEMLYTLSDFIAFKEMILSYKLFDFMWFTLAKRRSLHTYIEYNGMNQKKSYFFSQSRAYLIK